jgi:hypothetical protein
VDLDAALASAALSALASSARIRYGLRACAFRSAMVCSPIVRPPATSTTRSAISSSSVRMWLETSTAGPLRGQAAQDVTQLHPRARVEPGRRLVEQQHRRAGG